VIGGHTAEAFPRAGQHANGWYGVAPGVDATAKSLAAPPKTAQERKRPNNLGAFEIRITPRPGVDPATAQREAHLGGRPAEPLPPGENGTGIARFRQPDQGHADRPGVSRKKRRC